MSGTLLDRLECLWTRYETTTQLLPQLVPLLAKALLGSQTDLFDMVEFSSAVLTTCMLTVEEKDKKNLMIFTERLLSSLHLSSAKYFNNGDFDQDRYLDCVAAMISVWLDLTESPVIWPKIVLYTRGSNQHILDTLLQCSNVRIKMMEKALQQIRSITTTQLFLRYVLCLRHVTKPQFKLFALSNQPDVNQYRLWLIKNNIPSKIPIVEIITNPKHDQHILSALCTASSYVLPAKTEPMPISITDIPNVDDTSDHIDNLFFIDRGDDIVVEKSDEEEDVKTEVEDMDILNVTIEPIMTVRDEPISETKQPIKIKNLKPPKKHKVCKNIMIIDGSSPSKISSSEAANEVVNESTSKAAIEVVSETTNKGVSDASEDANDVINVAVCEATNEAASETNNEAVSDAVNEDTNAAVSEDTNDAVSDDTNEVVHEAVHEAVSEATSEAVSEAADNAVSEATSEAVSEVTNEAVHEATSEAVSEATSAAVSDDTNEAVHEAVHEATSEAFSEAADNEVANDAVSEVTNEAVHEAVSEATSEAVSEVTNEAVHESVSEATSEAVSEATSEAVSEVTNEAVHEVVSEATSEAVSKAASEAVSEDTSEAVHEAVSEATSEAVSEAADNAVIETAPKESMAHVSEAAPSKTQLTDPKISKELEQAEEKPSVESKENQIETLVNPCLISESLPLNPHSISLPISTESLALIEDSVSMTSSIRRSTRRRTTSVESDVSVDSISSRTRNRNKVILEDAIELETIAEDGNYPKKVKKNVVNSLPKSTRSRKGEASLTKEVPVDGFVNENAKTPSTEKTTKTNTKKKVRKLSHSSVEDTPQIPVTRTRRRKLAV